MAVVAVGMFAAVIVGDDDNVLPTIVGGDVVVGGLVVPKPHPVENDGVFDLDGKGVDDAVDDRLPPPILPPVPTPIPVPFVL